jgi:Uma2 family endonuclease
MLTWKEQIDWITSMPPGSRLHIDDVSWSDYEEVLDSLTERSGIHVRYDQGRLEVTTLSFRHERLTKLFGHLIAVLTQELGLDFFGAGSTTYKKEEEGRGLEPDDSFYIRSFSKVVGKDEIDLAVDPPPDLIVEVDLSNPSLDKLPIDFSLGVEEVWRHDGERVHFLARTASGYEPIANSNLFAFLPSSIMADFIEQGKSKGSNAMMQAYRTWVRSQLK